MNTKETETIDQLKAKNARLKTALAREVAKRSAHEVIIKRIIADMAPLHEVMNNSPYAVESWGKNICEFVAKELVELRRERDERRDEGQGTT